MSIYSLRDIVCMEDNIRTKKGHHIWGLHIHIFDKEPKFSISLVLSYFIGRMMREKGERGYIG